MPIPFIIAGAAAVAAAVGGKKAYDGYKTKSEANDITERAESKYKKRENQLNALNDISEEKLNNLGELELGIGKSFAEFKTLADDLLIKLEKNSNEDIKINIPKHKLDQIESLTISATEFLGTVVASGATGAAASFAVYSGVMAFAAASTGTPIAALSGAAAYNATMAAIGGGSIAAGGWGMAGGAIILGGAAIAPILAVAGWAYAKHAEKALENANQIEKEVRDAIRKMNLCDKHLKNTNNYIDKIYYSLEKINHTFNEYFDSLKGLHQKIVKFGGEKVSSELSEESLLVINNGYALAAIMTEVITTPIFKPKEVSNDGTVKVQTDNEGFNVLNEDALNNVLLTKEQEYNKFIINC